VLFCDEDFLSSQLAKTVTTQINISK